jgi:hypothetical protein
MSPPAPSAGTPLVVFSSDVRNMDDWAKRTAIPLTTADALGATYAKAHRWLLSLKTQLVQNYNWQESQHSDCRLLFSLDTPSIWRSSAGLPASPSLRLQLPLNATSFFSPDRRVQWEMVVHRDMFQTNRRLCPPISDILNLLQCLLTGMLTLVYEERLADADGTYRTTRGLPAADWVNANQAALIEIFGIQRYRALFKACTSTTGAYKLDIIPFER